MEVSDRKTILVRATRWLNQSFVVMHVAYNKKKYVWKLLYIHMLGYDVDFGHMEAVSLISSYK